MDYSYRSNSGGELLVEIFAIVLACLIVGFLWWRIITKMGYTGKTRWVLVVAIFFPLTAFLEICWFAFFPWPIHKELKRVREYMKITGLPEPSEVDLELDRLRGEMGMNQMKGKQKPK